MSVLIGRFIDRRDRRELVVRIERRFAELVRAIVELVLGFARSRLGGELLANGLERLHLAGTQLVEPDDVKAELACAPAR